MLQGVCIKCISSNSSDNSGVTTTKGGRRIDLHNPYSFLGFYKEGIDS